MSATAPSGSIASAMSGSEHTLSIGGKYLNDFLASHLHQPIAYTYHYSFHTIALQYRQLLAVVPLSC